MAAAGAVVTAYGTYQKGQAEQAAAKYQQRVAKNNAILAERSAVDAEQRGAVAEAQARARGRMIIGAQKAAFAAGGIDVGSDTVGDITSSQAGLNELDALTVRSNASREAAGFRTEGMNYNAQALALKAQGQNASYFSKMGAASTLLTGSADVANKWYTYNPPSATAGSTATYGDAGTAYQRSNYGGAGTYNPQQRSNYSAF